MGAKQAFFAHTEAPVSAVSDWSRLLIGCNRDQYAASLVARAVEDCDAHLLNLNVTSAGALTGDAGSDDYVATAYSKFPVQVELRVNHRNPECVCRSLQRYGFTVLEATGSGDNDGKPSNLDNLVRYLNV